MESAQTPNKKESCNASNLKFQILDAVEELTAGLYRFCRKTVMPKSNPSDGWSCFLVEAKLAQNYGAIPLLMGAPFTENPIVERILPALLYIKMTAIFDETLIEFISAGGFTVPRRYRNTMGGRIDFLVSVGKLIQPAHLTQIREKRNKLAHESSVGVSWEELESAISKIHAELKQLGFAEDRPALNCIAEQSSVRDAKTENGAGEQDYTCKIVEGEKLRGSFSFTVYYSP